MYCAITIDVESDLQEVRFLDINEIFYLLDLLGDMNIPSTFFVTGRFAEKMQDIVTVLADKGHEVAFHGYAHEAWKKGTNEKVKDLQKLKTVMKNLGFRPVGFRAPYLSADLHVLKILKKHGFTYDSSFLHKTFLELVPTLSRLLKYPHLYRGSRLCELTDSPLVEFPISTFSPLGMPYALSWLCLLKPSIYKAFTNTSNKDSEVLVFYMHPYDLLAKSEPITIPRYVPKRDPKAALSEFLNFLLSRSVKFTRLKDLLD